MVADQFLNGLDSHELRVEVAAMGIRWIEDLMRIMRSLDAVEGQEVGHGRPRRALPRPYSRSRKGATPRQPGSPNTTWPN